SLRSRRDAGVLRLRRLRRHRGARRAGRWPHPSRQDVDRRIRADRPGLRHRRQHDRPALDALTTHAAARPATAMADAFAAHDEVMQMPHRMAAIPLLLAALAASAGAPAAEVAYELDPAHTFPSFEADHLGGLSVWRGKFNASRGTVYLDREAGTGRLEVVVDTASIDYGLEAMNEQARGAELFDSARWP